MYVSRLCLPHIYSVLLWGSCSLILKEEYTLFQFYLCFIDRLLATINLYFPGLPSSWTLVRFLPADNASSCLWTLLCWSPHQDVDAKEKVRIDGKPIDIYGSILDFKPFTSVFQKRTCVIIDNVRVSKALNSEGHRELVFKLEKLIFLLNVKVVQSTPSVKRSCFRLNTVTSQYQTPEIRRFKFFDTFLSDFQMVWTHDWADHLNTRHFWQLYRHFCPGF